MEICDGDLVKVTNLNVYSNTDGAKLRVGFKAPKGEAFAVLLMGTIDKEAELKPEYFEKMLNDLGWVKKSEQTD